MIDSIKKSVDDLIAIPATSSLELSQHMAGASDLANTLLQHSSKEMQLVGKSLSMLLQTKRSSQESTAILEVIQAPACKPIQ